LFFFIALSAESLTIAYWSIVIVEAGKMMGHCLSNVYYYTRNKIKVKIALKLSFFLPQVFSNKISSEPYQY
jgi:hypothetical protein